MSDNKKGFFQEKFQFFMPTKQKKANNNEWTNYEDSRRVYQKDGDSFENTLNEMPCIDLERSNPLGKNFESLTFAGERSEDSCTTAESLKKGYRRCDILPTDDNYTGEHGDAFYNEVEGEDGVGFVERHNYLDRI